MDIINKDFCNDTRKRENKCNYCKKPLAYVDSPFGAIPTMALFERFYEDFKKEFELERRKLQNSIKVHIKEAMQEEINDLTDFFDQNKKELDLQVQELKYYKEQIEKDIKNKQKALESFIEKIYVNFQNTLELFLSLISTIFRLIQDFETEREIYIKKFFPEVKILVESIEKLKIFIPKAEIATKSIPYDNFDAFFDDGAQYYTNKLLQEKKYQFQRVWDEISLFKKLE
ncbi:MAG: hypothetical protein ACTSVK_16350 [Promethearchaeota archaeon]